jgi:hypothetical protein
MLNGDAHHSFTWEFELRIWPLLIFKDWNARKDTRKSPMSNVQGQESGVRSQKSEVRRL